MRNLAAHPRRRLRRLLLPFCCCAGLLIPLHQLSTAHAGVNSVYMADNNDCVQYVQNGTNAPYPLAISSYPSGVGAVCIVAQGTFSGTDVFAATVYDSNGKIDYSNSGPVATTGNTFVGFYNVQYPNGGWPDGAYRTVATLNGETVGTVSWTIGTVPPTSTQPPATNTPIPPTSTPVPPSATPQPASPTATAKPASPTGTSAPAGATTATPSATPGKPAPSPSATPGGEGSKPGGTGKPQGALYTGKGFQVMLPKGWKGSLNKSGASTFISTDKAVILLVHVYKTTATPDTGTERQVIQADIAGFEKNTRIAYGPYKLGALKGTAGTTHLHDGSALQVMVIADHRHVVVLFFLTAPHAPHQDAQAGAAILRSLHLTS